VAVGLSLDRETAIPRYEPKEVILTKEELTVLCWQWQETLRLQEWIIALSVCRARDMGDSRQGECAWIISKKEACISILDAIDFPPGHIHAQDMEKTLVHELLHLHFAAFASDEDYIDRAHEQAIDLIASGLIAQKRAA